MQTCVTVAMTGGPAAGGQMSRLRRIRATDHGSAPERTARVDLKLAVLGGSHSDKSLARVSAPTLPGWPGQHRRLHQPANAKCFSEQCPLVSVQVSLVFLSLTLSISFSDIKDTAF
jgi:hypothetical protein